MTTNELDNLYKSVSLANSAAFISALRTVHTDNSIPHLMFISKLNTYIKNYLPEGLRLCSSGIMTDEEESRMILHGKIIAAMMIILKDTRTYKELGEKMVMFLCFSSALGRSQMDLAELAVKAMSRGCTSLGYSWGNVEKAESLDVLTFQMAEKAAFKGADLECFSYSGRGNVMLKDRKLTVASFASADVTAFSTCNGLVEIQSRNARGERLKASVQNDAASLDSFADSFRRVQDESGRLSAFGMKDALSAGDRTVLQCMKDMEDGRYVLNAVAIDTNARTRGRIVNEELYKGAYTEDLIPYLYDDDCICGATVLGTGDNTEFSIADSYYEFAKHTAEKDQRSRCAFEAKVLRIRDDIKRINWIAAHGYIAVSMPVDGVTAVGQKAILAVSSIRGQGKGMYINVAAPWYDFDGPVHRFEDETVLENFAKEKETAIEAGKNMNRSQADDAARKELLGMFAQILSRTSRVGDSMDNYRKILASSFIFYCIGDNDSAAAAQSRAQYLNRLLCFAQSGIVTLPPREMSLPEEYATIIRCLSLFQAADRAPRLMSVLQESRPESLGGRIAALMLAESISNEYKDEFRTDRDAVRRKICEMAGVADEFCPTGEKTSGKYGSNERQHLEFKSSYVMRNDMKTPTPDLDYQGRGEVFGTICGFLNSDGGTLYLGVNNNGDPIMSEGYGLSGDMKWLCDNFSTVRASRFKKLGHDVMKPDTLDHYVLFLNTERFIYFKKDIADTITIEPTEDDDAIRITVPPCRYEIVYLYDDESHSSGCAYTRDGNSTVPMSHVAMSRRLMDLKHISKEVEFILTLQQAIDKKRKVIFKDYSSGNSGEVKDRLVVPINLFYNDENVLCYDLQSKSEKQFRLSRISAIETDVENPEYPHDFKPKKADVFRWINDFSYHIKARLDVGAKNYLLEEYSDARNLPADEFYQTEDGKWILDTHLQGLGAMRRFYLGLADKIEILPTEDSDKLIADIREYVKSELSDFIK